jgi:hypothetical protein
VVRIPTVRLTATMDTRRYPPAMTPDLSRRPAAIVAAAGLTALLAVGFAAYAVNTGTNGHPTAVMFSVGAVIFAALAATSVGVWFGNIAAQVLAAGLGVVLVFAGISLMLQTSILARLAGVQDLGILALLTGAALAGLVLVPQASRDWFLYERPKVTRT